MKLNIKKTFVTLAFAITLLLAFSLSAFSQDTCDQYPSRQHQASPQGGFSGGVFQYVQGSGIDTSQPKSGVTVYAVNQSTYETFYSVTDSDGIFGRSGTGGFDLYNGYVNQGQWDWYRLSDNEFMKNGLPICEYYDIIVGTGFFTPNPYTAFPNGYFGGNLQIWIDSFGIY